MDDEKSFHAIISKLLVHKLQSELLSKDLDLVTCIKVYTIIFDTLVEVLTRSNVHISNESMNYLAQQYYDATLVNGHQELNPHIFTQRASLASIETKEIALLATMLRGTDFTKPLIDEIKRRS